MAIVRSLAIGKARKSAGNLTYQTVKGRTIAREKPLHVANPDTPAQQAQRNRMRNAVAAWRAWFNILSPYFTYILGYGSAYNEFVRLNLPIANTSWIFGDNQVQMRLDTFVSSGKYGVSALNVEPSGTNAIVSVNDLQLRSDLLVGDQIAIIYQIDPGLEPDVPSPVLVTHNLTQPNVTALSTGGTISIPGIPWADISTHAALFYSSSRRISSTARAN